MDVGVVIQGVQYTFARGGIWGIRTIIGFGIAYAAVKVAERAHGDPVVNLAVVGGAFVLILSLQKLGENIARWTDRHFFREAYKSEQILSELSEKVRTIVETGPLLETVARRISESLHVRRVALLLDGAGGYRTGVRSGLRGVSGAQFSR
jgi:sigma-B regulation protein RsbU (phosphoserine phosphatase)